MNPTEYCGNRVSFGHEGYWCGKPAPEGIFQCDACKIRLLQAENEALKADNKRLKGFCWETDEAKEFLAAVKKDNEARNEKA